MPTCGNRHNEVPRKKFDLSEGPEVKLMKTSRKPKKLTLCLNQSWTSIDLFFFWFWFCKVSWMPKQKSIVQTALKKLIVFNVGVLP